MRHGYLIVREWEGFRPLTEVKTSIFGNMSTILRRQILEKKQSFYRRIITVGIGVFTKILDLFSDREESWDKQEFII